MRKKILTVVLSILLITALLAGCGGNGATGDANGGEVADGEPIVINIMCSIITEESAPFIEEKRDAFMAENPHVVINHIPSPVNDMIVNIVAMNAADDLPDAFFMPAEFKPQAHDLGIVADHDALLGEEFLNSLNARVVELARIEGQLMMVPWHVIPVGLIYRTDWLEEIGMDTIETMQDLRQAAIGFSEGENQWGFSLIGLNNGSGQSRFIQFVRAFGIKEVYQDENGQWVSDVLTDEFRAALQLFVDLDLVDGAVPPGSTETGFAEATALFGEEKTGLFISGSNGFGPILYHNPDLWDVLGSVPMPRQVRHVSNLQTSGFAITTASEHPEVVAEYLKFITGPQFNIAFAEGTGRLPVTNEGLANPLFEEPQFVGFVQAMEYALPTPIFPAYSELLDILGEAYNTMLGMGISLDEAMDQVERRLTVLLAEHND